MQAVKAFWPQIAKMGQAILIRTKDSKRRRNRRKWAEQVQQRPPQISNSSIRKRQGLPKLLSISTNRALKDIWHPRNSILSQKILKARKLKRVEMGKLGSFLRKKIFQIKGRLCTTFKKTNMQKHWKIIERAHKVDNSRENKRSSCRRSMLTKSAPNTANKLNRVQLSKVCRWLDQHQIVLVQPTKWWIQVSKIPQFLQPFRSDQTRKLFHHNTRDKLLFLTV